jgi:hypothetical protein
MYSTFNCAHGRLKGVCHEMNIFSEGLKNKNFLCPLFIKNQRQSFRFSERYLESVGVFEEASRHFRLIFSSKVSEKF